MPLISRRSATYLALPGALLLWSLLEPYVIDEQAYEVTLPRLPESWEGQRVAVIADLHIGMWLSNSQTVRRIIARVLKKRPALVLLAGDFVYLYDRNPSKEIAKAVNLVRPLVEAGLPTYAVLGNHDYRMPTERSSKDEALAERVRAALEAAGIRVLHNEAVPLASPTGRAAESPLYLVSIGSHVAHEDRPDVALAGLPHSASRLVLMHHPKSFKALPKGSAPVAVAAHTHGGQVRLPFTLARTWMSYSRENEVITDGWIHGYGEAGNHLYVNRGIGFSVVPLRFNCPPELTLLTLYQE
jgi:predicted MPP superfamily phosphohydrolase